MKPKNVRKIERIITLLMKAGALAEKLEELPSGLLAIEALECLDGTIERFSSLMEEPGLPGEELIRTLVEVFQPTEAKKHGLRFRGGFDEMILARPFSLARLGRLLDKARRLAGYSHQDRKELWGCQHLSDDGTPQYYVRRGDVMAVIGISGTPERPVLCVEFGG